MAEVLLKAQDAPVDHPMAYRQGHPVVVMEDGHEWGAEERLPKFLVVKMPGVPAANLERFLDTDADHVRRADMQLGIVPNGDLEPTMRRAWQIQMWRLPAAAQQLIGARGSVTVAVPGHYDPALHEPADFQWWQVKPILHNAVSNRFESFDL